MTRRKLPSLRASGQPAVSRDSEAQSKKSWELWTVGGSYPEEDSLAAMFISPSSL